ncbi:uncharacterized protein GGS25DRAFT_523855 [Hypoxylon fragiforme]|uniref:uncharacterized protein n=1 Tax=Hypoxylon fragiforme TaxID=63214 RepID=UPI0020C64D96|nr:uncharacterized protein GGS25DRAFT_523855 [Hypoxylon fragiforme]KAI2606186.1 hypothetical protein GGS25DRAFT_523855 [Hypoxylon fragiforme]
MSISGESDTQSSHKRFFGASRRSPVSSDSSSSISSSNPSRSPTPPPRRSSWGFTQKNPRTNHPSPSKPPRPPLRRKLKWPSLRSRAQNPQAKSLPHITMSSPAGPTTTLGGGPGTSLSGPNQDKSTVKHGLPMPGLSGSANGPIGNLLKGPVDDAGKLKDAALLVGIKLDLEAEVHATARVRGDIVVGLY